MSVAYNPLSGNFETKEPGPQGPAGTVSAAGDGSQGTPSISFASDTDTGLYRPGADQVAISTNGTGRLSIDSNGNIGVAAVGQESSYTDYAKAIVFGTSAETALGIVLRTGSTGTSSIAFADNSGSGAGAQDGLIEYSQTTQALNFHTAGNSSPRLVIDSSGRLGIGTSSPSSLLEVNGSSKFAGAISVDGGVSNENSSYGPGYLIQNRSAGARNLWTGQLNGSNTSTILADGSATFAGSVGVGTTVPDALLTVKASSSKIARFRTADTNFFGIDIGTNGSDYTFIESVKGGTGSYKPLAFFVGGSRAMDIDTDGRLLVGTSSARTDLITGTRGGRVQIEAAGGSGLDAIDNSSLCLTMGHNTSTGSANIFFTRTKSNSLGGVVSVAENDILGGLYFQGADGTDAVSAALIKAEVDGTPGADDMPGRIVLATTADGESTPTTRMTINSSGNVGVGTTVPDGLLTVRPSSGNSQVFIRTNDTTSLSQLIFGDSTDSNVGGVQYDHSDDSLQLHVGNIGEKVRLDSSGRLLVGTSSSTNNALLETNIHSVVTGDGSLGGAMFTAYCGTGSSTARSSVLGFQRSRGTTDGSMTSVSVDDRLGNVFFRGADGANFVDSASIQAFVDGTPGTNDMPGRLVFSVTESGNSSPTERMTINSSGAVLIATQSTNVSSNEKLTVNGISTFYRTSGTAAYFKRTGNDGDVVAFFRDTTGVGSISVTTTATAYNTSSDYRLKENVTAVTDGITRLQQLKPSRFNFIADPDTTVDGFLAHEVQTVVPEAITGEKDAVDDEGNPEYQGIDQSKLVPLLTAALQEAVAKIETLEAKVAALEAN